MHAPIKAAARIYICILMAPLCSSGYAQEAVLTPLAPTFPGNWSTGIWGVRTTDGCVPVWIIRRLSFQLPHPTELIDHASGIRYAISDLSKINAETIVVNFAQPTPYGMAVTLNRTGDGLDATTTLGTISLQDCSKITPLSPQ